MATVTYIGEFREFGYPHAPSMADAVEQLTEDVRVTVERYIRNGVTVAAVPGSSRDVLDGATHLVSPSLLTDGTYLWRKDLAHYVNKYGIALPEQFIAHAVAAVRRPTELTSEQQQAVGELLRRMHADPQAQEP